ncbi:tRNA (uracil-5-)-methyltransferase [Angomonas deanei]|nr:tRNA (uracil-5-)-methyltransferase [Angomonas deanei]|eukprot:EPY29948.1 tRNA (uracil-5-)-methyltransferase [Angomonas deanei]
MEEQLQKKEAHCLSVMRSIVPRSCGKDAYRQRFQGVIPSPKLEGYRNHVNLSFGVSSEGAPTVGFQTGALVEGAATIESAVGEKNIVTMHPIAKVVAQTAMQAVEAFRAPEKGGLTVFDKVSGSGFWRRLQIRHNIKGEVLVDLELDQTCTTPERFAEVKETLKELYTSPATTAALCAAFGKDTAQVTSLQCHCHTGISSMPPDTPREVLHGSPVLVEYLSGLQYELSPTAFFQVNTEGMEQLMERVQTAAELGPSTTLLDLCSGTGTIGLTLARHVGRVIGIELVEEAVLNARRNAEMNHITNAQFHVGRVENVLPSVIRGLTAEEKKDIVAILDPPRAGVNGTVLKWIRGTPTIRKVVYISCEQKALERDCPAFTKPPTKAYSGRPFEVTSAFGVDLFPHTHHVEMIAVLTRREEAKESEEVKESAP